MKHILVTGGVGFIGSHFVELQLQLYPDVHITNLDLMTYAAHPDTAQELATLAPSRYRFVRGDIASPDLVDYLKTNHVDAIVNFAAETHVDRSILDPGSFVRTNIVGVQNLLTCAREAKVPLLHVSTDEVYGSLPPDAAPTTERSGLDPNSPYAASKAGADLIALASARTYQQKVWITRCTNNYGPRQFPEKLLPLVITNALESKAIPIYGDGRQVRDWIYVVDHCRAIDLVLRKGRAGEVYNISAQDQRPNIDVVREVLKRMNRPESLMTHVGDRPAHDRRYALDAGKTRTELGWKPQVSLDDGLARTIDWYLKHEAWWRKVRSGDFEKYYTANYADKFEQKGHNP